jgi:hypothetical protein
MVVASLYSVGDDRETCISYLLSLENAVAADILCMAGLIKIGHSRNEKATVVVKAEWEKFIIEESLGDLIEGVNQTYVQKAFLHQHWNERETRALAHRPI